MTNIYKNISDKPVDVVIPSEDGSSITREVIQPGHIITLNYPGLDNYVQSKRLVKIHKESGAFVLWAEKVIEAVSDAAEKIEDVAESVIDTVEDIKEGVEETLIEASNIVENIEETTDEAIEKVKDLIEDGKEVIEEVVKPVIAAKSKLTSKKK